MVFSILFIILFQTQGEQDTTTMVDISVMVWYTPQFRNTFETEEDMNVFVDLIFAETNQGYINSQIPVGYQQYQTELSTILDRTINNSRHYYQQY